MSIQWTLTLSEVQIAVMQAISEAEIRGDFDFDPKKDKQPKDTGQEWVGSRFSYWVMHIRPLLANSLIFHESVWYGPNNKLAFNRYGLTEKGEHVLAVIQIEIEEMRNRHMLGDGGRHDGLNPSRRQIEQSKARKTV